MKILLMAGGEGTRLWPLSRKSNPKQINSLFDGQTLLEKTLIRLRKGFSNRDIYVSTLAKYSTAVRTQSHGIPKQNYIIEPVRRDRGPAIGLAATIINSRHPGEILATVWADQYIPQESLYLKALRAAEAVVKKHRDFTTLIGIKPRYPATTLGYIETGKRLGRIKGHDYYLSKSFVEKPKLATAKKLVKRNFLWNPGIFVWDAKYLLGLYEKYSFFNARLLQKIGRASSSPALQKTINKIYPRLHAEEIETAILEKTPTKIVIPANFTWADIGTYQSFKEIFAKPGRNLTYGLVAATKSDDNFLYESNSHKLIATLGLQGTVVVDTEDVLLVAQKDAALELKKFLAKLGQNKKLNRFL
jgi:mannose-1-phosphate guanylyltransferase